MNGQLAIVAVIDTQAALLTQSLSGCTYLMDNNRHAGSTGEGTGRLVVRVVGSQIMNWLAIGLGSNSVAVALWKIGGDAVDQQIMVPLLFDSPTWNNSGGYWWGAMVDANAPGKYNYTLYFNIREYNADGSVKKDTKLEYVSYVDVQSPFTMDTPAGWPYQRPLRQRMQRQASTVAAADSLHARALADGSIFDPKSHRQPFPARF
jgi:hypothetical protein